jgi:RNA polymerase sigma factor for flagellar operon FliA
MASPAPGPGERLEHEELRHGVQRSLAKLTEAQRVVTTLYYVEDYSVREIGQFLGLADSAVKKRLHDARRRLEQDMRHPAELELTQVRRSRRRRAKPVGVGVEASAAPGPVGDGPVPVESARKPRAARGTRPAPDGADAPQVGGEPGEGLSPEEGAPTPTVHVTVTPERMFRREDDGQQAEEAMWREYLAEGTQAQRNRLLEHYLPLVNAQVRRLVGRLPGSVRQEELLSAGVIGLMDAVTKFDPAKGVRFEAFAPRRVYGAIMDELRSMDWVPRLARKRAGRLGRAMQGLVQRLGRLPTDEEVLGALGVDAPEYRRIVRDAAVVGVVSLSRALSGSEQGGRELQEMDLLDDPGQVNPLTAYERLDLKNTLLRGLSRAERLIVILYYYEQMTMKEIADTLDLSESRISQMHTLTMQRLRARFERRGWSAVQAGA